MPQTLEQITKDFLSYKALTRRQKGVTIHAEKYVEDVGKLLALLGADTKPKSAKATSGTQDAATPKE